MKYSRFKAIGRALLRQLMDTLLMMGIAFGVSPTVFIEATNWGRTEGTEAGAAPAPDNPRTARITPRDVGWPPAELPFRAACTEPETPLSRAERAEWVALVKRLR
jgi:hypothetical protein